MGIWKCSLNHLFKYPRERMPHIAIVPYVEMTRCEMLEKVPPVISGSRRRIWMRLAALSVKFRKAPLDGCHPP